MITEKITLRQLYLGFLGFVVALGLLTGLFYGCKAVIHQITKERPHFTTGTVLQREFHPAHYDDWIEQRYMGETCSGSGDNRTCTSIYMPVYHHDYVPDDWNIQIQNCNVMHKDGSQWVDKHGANKCFKKWVGVTHDQFDSVNVSEEWNG